MPKVLPKWHKNVWKMFYYDYQKWRKKRDGRKEEMKFYFLLGWIHSLIRLLTLRERTKRTWSISSGISRHCGVYHNFIDILLENVSASAPFPCYDKERKKNQNKKNEIKTSLSMGFGCRYQNWKKCTRFTQFSMAYSVVSFCVWWMLWRVLMLSVSNMVRFVFISFTNKLTRVANQNWQQILFFSFLKSIYLYHRKCWSFVCVSFEAFHFQPFILTEFECVY